MWPILPLTTALHLARPYKGNEKRWFSVCDFSLLSISVSYSLPLYLSKCFRLSPAESLIPKSYILPFPRSNPLSPYTPPPET